MKRLIFTILIAVATVSMLRAQEPTSPEAIPSSRLQDSLSATPVPTTVPVIEELPAPTFYADLSDSSASMPTSVSPVRRKQRFLPMKRRIDREINKIKFAYAGEIALGLTVSYGTLSSDDTDYLLILDNLNLNGSIFTINPSVGYFFKDNMSAGVLSGAIFLLIYGVLLEQFTGLDPSLPVHPTFLYESIWCLLGFFLLWAYMKRRKFHGELILMYVMWYGLGRFFIEGLRTDSLIIPGTSLRASQVLAAVLVVVCAVTLVVMRRKVQEKLRLDPAAPILYRDTEEGKQVIAGTFYPKKGKAKADEAVQEVQQPEAELDELDAAVEPDEQEEISSPEEADAQQEAAPEEAALEDQEPERVDPETTDNEEEGQAPKEQ